MLLKIELENFFSIKNKICIDLRAGNINSAQSRELQDNVIEWNHQKVLKTIGLFGPNASGKSNIIKAIHFCCRTILESHQYNEGGMFNFMPFKFDHFDSKPSSFFIDFVCENIEYEYSFTLNRSQILTESLFYFPNNRRAKIFVRNEKNEYSFGSVTIPAVKDVIESTSNVNLFLSRANNMHREFAQKIYRYFLNTLMLGLIPLNDKLVEDSFSKYKELILKALAICDSDISDVKLTHEKIKMPIPNIEEQMKIAFKEAEIDSIKIETFHQFNEKISFDIETEESNGTKKLFAVLIRLIDVVKNQKSLMLDEFDASLHTRLADFILDLIHASSKAQFLFTSHNTNLIDVKRLRKDQIVFVNKNNEGATDVYSLYDYKDFRENMDAQKGYLQERFDAVPYVDSSVQTLKNLLGE